MKRNRSQALLELFGSSRAIKKLKHLGYEESQDNHSNNNDDSSSDDIEGTATTDSESDSDEQPSKKIEITPRLPKLQRNLAKAPKPLTFSLPNVQSLHDFPNASDVQVGPTLKENPAAPILGRSHSKPQKLWTSLTSNQSGQKTIHMSKNSADEQLSNRALKATKKTPMKILPIPSAAPVVSTSRPQLNFKAMQKSFKESDDLRKKKLVPLGTSNPQKSAKVSNQREISFSDSQSSDPKLVSLGTVKK